MKRKICVVTTSRAEYDLLYTLIKEIQNDSDLILQLIVSGTHVETKFGFTLSNIVEDGFKIDKAINIEMNDDTEVGISNSVGMGIWKFTEAFQDLRPDIVTILGDRIELIAVAIAATISRIPIAHIHGGEETQGVIDNVIRHAITKMSAIHFASTEVYKKRIIQMGENPKFVYNYGAPGLDNIHRLLHINE